MSEESPRARRGKFVPVPVLTPVLVPAEALKAMEKVASHINEMQKIYEDYGSVFDQLVAEQIGHDKEVRPRPLVLRFSPCARRRRLLPPNAAPVPHFIANPTWGTCLAYVVYAIFSTWPLGAEYIYKVLEYLAECIFKVNAKYRRLGVTSVHRFTSKSQFPRVRVARLALGLFPSPQPLFNRLPRVSPKVTEISMGEFLAHSTAVWLNPHPSLGRIRKDPEMTVFGERAESWNSSPHFSLRAPTFSCRVHTLSHVLHLWLL